uniref:Uncharacterized protein n=1 Tax=Micrurus lemniscatus lemniscatus TaxID=129467 RepID=A0A2D4HHF9_MICLE
MLVKNGIKIQSDCKADSHWFLNLIFQLLKIAAINYMCYNLPPYFHLLHTFLSQFECYVYMGLWGLKSNKFGGTGIAKCAQIVSHFFRKKIILRETMKQR